MTAYILTTEQHAQIVDALEYSTPIAAFDDMQAEATAQIEHNTALAMLKAMKPVEPVLWRFNQSDMVTPYKEAHPTWNPLYAKEQQ